MSNFEPTLLGKPVNALPNDPAEAKLEAFPNDFSDRKYWVTLDYPHFTSLCPVTGQPDFAHIIIRYIPDQKVVETKSLKLYLQAFRNQIAFNEKWVNRILNDLVAVLEPHQMEIEGKFASRGGISLSVNISYPQA